MPQLTGFPQYPNEELEPRVYNALLAVHIAIQNLDSAYGLITGVDEYDSSEWAALGPQGAMTHGRYTRGFAVSNGPIIPGNIINLFNSSGVLTMRKADASDPTKMAHGIATTSGNGVLVEFNWLRCFTNLIGSLSLGTLYYLSDATPGLISNTKPTTSGHIVQPIGLAVGSTSLLMDIPLSIIVIP